VDGVAALGKRIGALDLGRGGQTQVVNFEEPRRIPETQRFQTAAILEDTKNQGIEFVRAWDAGSISIISLMPFALSLVSIGVWIGVSVGVHQVDPQVATQTAFTIASYIVTAGKLQA